MRMPLRPTGEAEPATRPYARYLVVGHEPQVGGLEGVLELDLVDAQVAADGDEDRLAVGGVEDGLERPRRRMPRNAADCSMVFWPGVLTSSSGSGASGDGLRLAELRLLALAA